MPQLLVTTAESADNLRHTLAVALYPLYILLLLRNQLRTSYLSEIEIQYRAENILVLRTAFKRLRFLAV